MLNQTAFRGVLFYMDLKNEIKRLWRDCLRDSEEYIDMYFSRVYADSQALYHTSDGHVIASALLQQFPFLFHGTTTTMGYITGAMTKRSMRGRGLMASLVVDALKRSAETGDMLCALMPAHDWLYFYFDRFGFSTVFLCDTQRFTAAHQFTTTHQYHPVNDPYSEEMYATFATLQLQRGDGVLQTKRDFINVLDDLNMRHCGRFVAVGRQDAPLAAMAWAVDKGDVVQINEVLGLDDDARHGAMQEIRNAFPDRPIRYMAPASEDIRRHLYARGMGRIVNVELCLRLLAEANPTWHSNIRVRDSLLSHNNGIYCIADGACRKVPFIPESIHLDFDISVEVLNRIVFSAPSTGEILGFPSQRAHLSLMLR